MNAQIPNLEEAANVAAEFIYSIDNLPNEVSHLLQEIKHCETRVQELQLDIEKDSAKYIRHSRRASSAAGTPPSPSSRAPSPKTVSIPAKITASYAEIQELAQEKCVLANRLIEIITRTRAKLDIDITKVCTLQGDPPETIAAAVAAASKPLTGLAALSAESFGAPGRNPALAISESLRNALTIPSAPDPRAAAVQSAAASSPSPSASHATKKRRITTTTSIKISPAATPTKHRSASPTIAAPAAPHVPTKSRLSRQVQIAVEDNDLDLDADGDEEADGDAEEEVEDETLYCFCQKQSYGDMIACDNNKCPYEWFHLACVGLKQPTDEQWYCSVCIKEMGIVQPAAPSRKGRKK